MRSDPDVQTAVAAFDIGLPEMALTGKSGELLGRVAGSSLEFHEYREYAPGDDIRHLDWQAYARTDQLMVRLFRNEVSPRVEVVLDTSCSMNTGDGTKNRVTRQLASAMMLLAAKLGSRPRLIVLRDDRTVLEIGIDDLDQLLTMNLDSTSSLAEILAERPLSARQQAIRIIISDFLFAHDPNSLVTKLTAGASGAWMVQLLTGWESNPTHFGGRHLIDIESEAELDLVLDESSITGYLERLKRLQQGLQVAGRRRRAQLVTTVVDQGLMHACRTDLVRAGLLKVT